MFDRLLCPNLSSRDQCDDLPFLPASVLRRAMRLMAIALFIQACCFDLAPRTFAQQVDAENEAIRDTLVHAESTDGRSSEAASVLPQYVTLDGIVVDREDGTPLPGAHVFIAQSMKGTTTDENGRFTLSRVPLGAKRLYASMLGYGPEHYDLFLREDTSYTFAFRLRPRVIESEGVVVEAERDPEWHRRLERFKEMFLGSSRWAAQCTIENPEALRFDSKWWGKFTAQASEPLVVTNRALGYRITYFLEEFEASGGVIKWDGEPLFSHLVPSSIAQADQWRNNREEAYRGSLRHFLRSLMEDRLEEEEFEMYRIPRAGMFRTVQKADRFLASRDRLLSVDADSVYRLDFRGRLEVIYRGEPESKEYRQWAGQHARPEPVQTSQIRLNDPPVRIDRNGKIVEPYGATVYLYFSFVERLAELVPLEYTPPDTPPLIGRGYKRLDRLPPPSLDLLPEAH